jgi:hypothetical protein
MRLMTPGASDFKRVSGRHIIGEHYGVLQAFRANGFVEFADRLGTMRR